MRPSLLAIVPVVLACSSGTDTEPGSGAVEIRLEPNVASLLVNDTTRARLVDATGQVYPDGSVDWHSTNTSVAVVDANGLVRGTAPGSATIVATVGPRTTSIALTVAGTLHRQPISADEVWSSSGNPHVVRGRIRVGAPSEVTLTMEPGLEVVFEDSAGLTFGVQGIGALVARGTSSAPITLRGVSLAPAPGEWIGLTFRGATTSELRHVTLTGCGGARNDEQPQACVVLGHRIFASEPTTVMLDHVTVENAARAAIILQGESRFAPGAAQLSARNVRGHVATLPAAAAGGFPKGGSFSGNDSNVVRVTRDTVRESATWENSGLSWSILEPVLIEGPQTPVLTLLPGSSFTFASGGGFTVGKNERGGLRIGEAGGTTVTLTSTDPNGWAGVVFFPHAVESSIREALLEHCGNFNDSGYGRGCIFAIGNFSGTAPAPVLQNVTIRKGVDTGLGLIGGARLGDGSANLTIVETYGSPGSPVSVYFGDVSSIPVGEYAGNQLDGIWILHSEITASEAWRNHGIPYLIRQGLSVGHAAAPVLTLGPGTILRFAPGNLLVIGAFAPGGLRALGAEGAPVTFTGDVESPGAWGGIQIGPRALPSTLLDRATVEYAGDAIRVAQDNGEIIWRTRIRRGSGCAITRMSGTPWTTDFTAVHLANEFEDNGGPNQCGP